MVCSFRCAYVFCGQNDGNIILIKTQIPSMICVGCGFFLRYWFVGMGSCVVGIYFISHRWFVGMSSCRLCVVGRWFNLHQGLW